MFKICTALLLVIVVPAIFAGTVDFPAENLQETSDVLEDVDAALNSLNCNLGYGCFQNRHYYFETKNKRTRDEASQFCRSINMSLVSVETCAEDNFITNMIKNNECYKNNFWTSGYRTDSSTFFWADGSKMPYTDWMRGEPNFGKNQYCVAYHSSYVQWSDEVCSNKYFFICESNNRC